MHPYNGRVLQLCEAIERPYMNTSVLRLIAILSLVGACFVSPVAIAQNGAGRLDAAERQRLRSELRQQSLDTRMHGQPPLHYQQAPAIPAADGYANPLGGPGRVRPDGLPRLSPEERQQLRLQLRESRQR